MRTFYILMFITVWQMCGCVQTTIVETADQPVEEEETVIIRKTVPKVVQKVKVLFNISADYPSGEIEDKTVSVYLDGQHVPPYTSLEVGERVFIVEKKGYEKKEVEANVVDSNGDGQFFLTCQLTAKDRIILFQMTDEKTNDPIDPDKVYIANAQGKDNKPIQISDRAYVKPGKKVIVVHKEGYESYSEEIEIDPDEDPYSLDIQLTPAE